jgi:hypothetical protein
VLLPLYAPLSFAITRPRVRSLQSLAAWERVWQECGTASSDQNLNPGHWAFATEVVMDDRAHLLSSEQIAWLLDHVIDQGLNITDVLMIKGHMEAEVYLGLVMLALGPDNSFVLIKMQSVVNNPWHVRAWDITGSSLASISRNETGWGGTPPKHNAISPRGDSLEQGEMKQTMRCN